MTSRRAWIAAAAVFAAIGLGIELMHKPARRQRAVSRAITAGGGLSTEPAISPDGRWIVYASDRGGGRMELWVQPAGGGTPRRLTSGEEDSRSPSFSPDATRVAFHTESGVWVIPAAGGTPRLLAPRGRDPRFSPDGRQIAYWVCDDNRGQVLTAPANGGPGRMVCAECTQARHPLWSPDGRIIVFVGEHRGDWDWFAVSAGGGSPLSSGALSIIDMREMPVPAAWTRSGILFVAYRDARADLWRVPMMQEVAQVSSAAQRIASGGGAEIHPSAAHDGTVVFTAAAVEPAVWVLPLDGRGSAAGEPLRITAGTQPRVTADGRGLVFRRGGTVWLRDLTAGRETALALRPAPDDSAVLLSPDGARVAWRSEGGLFVAAVARPDAARALGRHYGRPVAWSPDGRLLIYQPAVRTLGAVDPDTGGSRPLLFHRGANLHEPRFSPDGRELALYTSAPHQFRRRLFVAPPEAPASQWTPVTGEQDHGRNPAWWPGGDLLYYISERDGHRCIWAWRRPHGPHHPVRHFHGARVSLTDPRNPLETTLAAARDKLVFTAYEITGNVRLMRPPE